MAQSVKLAVYSLQVRSCAICKLENLSFVNHALGSGYGTDRATTPAASCRDYLVAETMEWARVVVVHGARQSGKTTLAKAIPES